MHDFDGFWVNSGIFGLIFRDFWEFINFLLFFGYMSEKCPLKVNFRLNALKTSFYDGFMSKKGGGVLSHNFWQIAYHFIIRPRCWTDWKMRRKTLLWPLKLHNSALFALCFKKSTKIKNGFWCVKFSMVWSTIEPETFKAQRRHFQVESTNMGNKRQISVVKSDKNDPF